MPLPTGPTVTFLFTDIEGSTRLERAVGSATWATLVARHDVLLRAAIEAHEGVVVKTEGDSFFAAFARPANAAAAVVAAQRAVAAEPWPADATIRVRMGAHVGDGTLRSGRPGDPEDYVGIDVNYAARIAAAGNGGQIVVSDAFASVIRSEIGAARDLADVELTDEGLRAVKDFDEPLRLHRLVVPGAADDARRLRTIDAPSNLPADVTELVGREGEIDLVGDELRTNRIVTLTGPGGSGKTRLALGAARAISDRFPNGTWFVDLESLRDAGMLEATIAATIGVGDTAGEAIDDVLRAHLRDRTVLLVLDNLEQLLPAAADSVSGLVRGASGLRVLITSRELLRIGGERGHAVPPLEASAGMTLFVDRARSNRPDLVLTDDAFATIRSICERLGGLPLAIELAAARVRSLSLTQIEDRLGRSLDLAGGARDLPERQRTLRGAISWSYDLLSDEERRLFRRLAVFAGGCAFDEAEAVTNADGDLGLDLLDGLESLGDKSLLRIEPIDPADAPEDQETRFGFHPLLREYAIERLVESGEGPALERRHAAVMADLAERVGAGILTAGATTMRQLDDEAFNLRAAIDWSLAHQEPAIGMRIMGSIWRWYQQRGRLREGRAVLAGLFALPEGDVGLRIRTLAAEGGLAYWIDDIPGARAAYEARLALAESTGDVGLIADAHYDLGFVFMVEKDEAGLRFHEQQALDGYLKAGRESDAIRARQSFVLALFLAGDFAEARTHQEAAIAAFRRHFSDTEVADSSTLLSAILYRLGEPPAAWSAMSEALRFFGAGNLFSGLARALLMAAILEVVHGDPAFGARIAGATHELARANNVMLAPITVLHLSDPVDLARERLGPDQADELVAEGAAMRLDDVVAEILAVDPASLALAVTAPGGAAGQAR